MIKKYFIRGLLITIPIGATFLILKTMVISLEGLLGGILREQTKYYIPGFGIVVLISFIMLIGVFGGNIIGQKIVDMWDHLLNRLPIVNKIYSIIKSVVDTISTSTNKKFDRVYAVEFPRKDIYCLAFVTNDTSINIPALKKIDLVHIFIPTSPNPTSGYFMMIPKKDLIELPISAEEGMKMILSGGYYIPPENINNDHDKANGKKNLKSIFSFKKKVIQT